MTDVGDHVRCSEMSPSTKGGSYYKPRHRKKSVRGMVFLVETASAGKVLGLEKGSGFVLVKLREKGVMP